MVYAVLHKLNPPIASDLCHAIEKWSPDLHLITAFVSVTSFSRSQCSLTTWYDTFGSQVLTDTQYLCNNIVQSMVHVNLNYVRTLLLMQRGI